jgi:hypothetical protein
VPAIALDFDLDPAHFKAHRSSIILWSVWSLKHIDVRYLGSVRSHVYHIESTQPSKVESLPKYQIAAFWRCTTIQSIGLANTLSCSDHVLLRARVRGFCGVQAEAGRECASLGGIARRVVVVPEAAHRRDTGLPLRWYNDSVFA